MWVFSCGSDEVLPPMYYTVVNNYSFTGLESFSYTYKIVNFNPKSAKWFSHLLCDTVGEFFLLVSLIKLIQVFPLSFR